MEKIIQENQRNKPGVQYLKNKITRKKEQEKRRGDIQRNNKVPTSDQHKRRQ